LSHLHRKVALQEAETVIRLPKLRTVADLVVTLQNNPFGALVLLLILGMLLAAWLAR